MRTWLKDIREDKGFTHEHVATESGVSRSYYTNIENGIKTPSVSAAKSIAKSLGFSWEIFFNEESSLREQSNTG